MDTKLTLKLNQEIIEKAKRYASDQKMSLSRIIENYLDSLTSQQKDEIQISPFVKSLSGKVDISAGYDYHPDYTDYLGQKYK